MSSRSSLRYIGADVPFDRIVRHRVEIGEECHQLALIGIIQETRLVLIYDERKMGDLSYEEEEQYIRWRLIIAWSGFGAHVDDDRDRAELALALVEHRKHVLLEHFDIRLIQHSSGGMKGWNPSSSNASVVPSNAWPAEAGPPVRGLRRQP